jgi:hypothetical protein
VGESDPAVELRVAGELPFESGPADQDEPDVVAVEVVVELFQALVFSRSASSTMSGSVCRASSKSNINSGS